MKQHFCTLRSITSISQNLNLQFMKRSLSNQFTLKQITFILLVQYFISSVIGLEVTNVGPDIFVLIDLVVSIFGLEFSTKTRHTQINHYQTIRSNISHFQTNHS